MEIRFQSSPKEVKGMCTEELRANFLVQQLMKPDELSLVYSHYDRVIIGGVKPLQQKVPLHNEPELRADYFLERRELGIINVAGKGTVEADGVVYELDKLDALYLGKGTKSVQFSSVSEKEPACFFLMSTTAHHTYPNKKMTKDEASPVNLGETATANKRTIYKYIHADGIQSCQLVMGLTVLAEGSVWNSVPPHTHTRRMEVYFYFDVPGQHRLFHLMGEPTETRHIVTANHEAVISPPWSVHCGPGTTNYGFIWAMAGENYTFTDMDPVAIADMR
ncbi:MAG: 5-dehydro-4-deoxy-D-glucuronate isomerase [Bacteroidota bacterium]|nr:5-dehydro-4-deoxy-D-glucuronate isomerase [Bacteroidota bacterium]